MARKRDLFVIEAPGKIARLTALLASLSPDAKVIATSGHIRAFPDDPKVLGITPDGEMLGRNYKPGTREKLLSAFSAPDIGRIVICRSSNFI